MGYNKLHDYWYFPSSKVKTDCGTVLSQGHEVTDDVIQCLHYNPCDVIWHIDDNRNFSYGPQTRKVGGNSSKCLFYHSIHLFSLSLSLSPLSRSLKLLQVSKSGHCSSLHLLMRSQALKLIDHGHWWRHVLINSKTDNIITWWRYESVTSSVRVRWYDVVIHHEARSGQKFSKWSP